jgi:microcompartment protein CcmL/EutN
MTDALGMIETRSFPAVVEAADAAVKAARVELMSYEKPAAWARSWRCTSSRVRT